MKYHTPNPPAAQPSQDCFLNAMLSADMPPPKPTTLDALIAEEVEEGKIVPFPFTDGKRNARGGDVGKLVKSPTGIDRRKTPLI